jgi:nicotinamide mononucleotide adenylyltransferase
MARIPSASVHGRFQPFHNEHLEYVLEAKERTEFLWVGITKFEINPSEFTPLGRPRERPENNPLTYFERVSMITAALKESGLQTDSFGFVPFPIETPQRLGAFMPTTVPCFTTICEDWNREKISILRQYGYSVTVLWERPVKLITGGAIREDIISGGSTWESLVPPATVRAIKQLSLRERLLKLRSSAAIDRVDQINPTKHEGEDPK